MSAAAIAAGKAWVELGIRDKTGKSLDAIQARLNKWGLGLAAVGGVLTTAAGSILGALTAAASKFASFGSEIFDMQAATGLSAESLSGLQYAAEQSGASLADVGASMKGLAKLALGAERGTKAAKKTLDALGISAADFLAATPEARLGMVADGLLAIEDPGLRAAIGMEALGRGAQSLASMLAGGSAGIAKLTAEARELGLTLTDEQAQKADDLGDAWGRLVGNGWGIAIQTGAALADSLTFILDTLVVVGKGVVEFIKNNQGLVVAAAAVAVVLGVVGGGLIALGMIMMGATAAAGFVATAIGGITAVLAAIFSPLGLVVAIIVGMSAALVYLVADWLLFSDTGRGTLAILTAALQSFWAFASKVFGGMYDAIVAGNWGLAGDVLMAGLNVAVALGILKLQEQFGAFRAWVEKLFADIAVKAFDQMTGILIAMNAASVANGLGELPGLDLAKGSLGMARGAAVAVGSGADARQRGGLVAAEAALAAAQMELDRAIDAAGRAREEAAAKNNADVEKELAESLETSDFGSGSLAGTFNAAVAGMLKDSAPAASAAERTATASEKQVGLLEEIRDEVEGGLGVEVAE